jgi:hypothetical protein
MSDYLHDNPFIEAEPYVGRALEASRSQPIASSNGRPEAEPSAALRRAVLDNVREEIRPEVAYAFDLAQASAS